MNQRKAKGCLLASVLWCLILIVLALAYKFLVSPLLTERLTEDTGSSSQYTDELRIAADSFSGYALLRSDELKGDLRSKGIKLSIVDDGADYEARLLSLKHGDTDMAAFTIDSYLSAGERAGEFPGSIVLIIDETKGGDAIVAPSKSLSSLQALNDPSARIVLTPNSPSEFLARVVIAHFNLPNLPANWIEASDGPDAVLNEIRRARPSEKRAFVLWEPFVSRAVKDHNCEILLDSSKIEGYIVDVLVVRRAFLLEHPDQVNTFVEAYLRAAFTHHQRDGGFVELIQKDSVSAGKRLSKAQAEQVVQGIQWKNTLENYAHFGLDEGGTLPHLEDMISNIVDVLIKTDAVQKDPLSGKYHTLFYQKVLADLRAKDFHPGRRLNVAEGIGESLESMESVRITKEAKALSEMQWEQLRPVGELRIKPLDFVRGSSRISMTSQRDLRELAKQLKTFPEFYVRLIGQTRAEGDAEANRILAEERADGVARALISEGVGEQRIRTEAAPSLEKTGAAQSVRFIVGQLPF